MMLPRNAEAPSLRIDGVRHELSTLAILHRAERLPGGLPRDIRCRRSDDAPVGALIAHPHL
jgi:hypothetical protein